jgi:putative intracellular protease/amidase
MRLTIVATLVGLVPFAFAHGGENHGHDPAMNMTDKPLHYAMMVFPGFQPLDIYGPLDVIGGIGMVVPNQALHLSVLSRTMDPVSSAIGAAMPNMSHAHGNFGHSIMPTNTYQDVLSKPDFCPETGDIDVLFVPGGAGTRADMTEEIAFVKEMFPRVFYPDPHSAVFR